MASVNKVILVGNLGADPETRYLPSGDAVANVRLATTDRFKDKASGDMKELTEWHRVVFFGRLAEVVSEYLKKGSSIYVEGRIRTRKWTDQAGQERYSTEIVGEQMQMLGGRRDSAESGGRDSAAAESRSASSAPRSANGGGRPASNSSRATVPAGGGFDEMDDDIPF